MRARSIPSFRTPAVVGSVLAAVIAGTAVAGTGVGGLFELGVANTVNAVTSLSGAAAGPAASPSPMLRVTNTATSGALGASITSSGGPALQLRVLSPSGAARPAPMTVDSGTRVVNLNADRLDSLDSTSFLRSTGKAVDADLLDGKDSTAFLPSAGKAADADRLDNLDSTSFLRSTGKAVDANLLDGKDSTAFVTATSGKAADADKLDGMEPGQLPIGGVKVRYLPVHPIESAAGTVTQGYVECPLGTYAIGGGANVLDPDQLLVASFPDVATRWSAYVKNAAATDSPFYVYAICAAVGTYDGPTLGTGGSNLRGE